MGQLPFKGGMPDCTCISEIRWWACWYKLSRNEGMLCLKGESCCQSHCWQYLACVQSRSSQLPLCSEHHDSQKFGSRAFHGCLSICHGSWPCASSSLPFRICLHGVFTLLWWQLAATCNKARFPYAPSHLCHVGLKSLIIDVATAMGYAIAVLWKKCYL